MTDFTLQLDLSVRLLIAAALGAVIGVEREIHGHPAGMRTHLLVALGSAIFTELSIFGFQSTTSTPLDPSRVAAQIVSGIGFLGADGGRDRILVRRKSQRNKGQRNQTHVRGLPRRQQLV